MKDLASGTVYSERQVKEENGLGRSVAENTPNTSQPMSESGGSGVRDFPGAA